MRFLLTFSLFFLLSQRLTTEQFYNFIVWNVGQGLWNTYTDYDQCIHFDMGGEKLPIFEANQLCKKKKNFILITHDDWDHISGIKTFTRNIPNYCIFYPKAKNGKFFKKLKICKQIPKEVTIVSYGNDKKSKNASSIVYLLMNKILIPGDSIVSEERKWFYKLPRLRLLILGHHGSKTSTSLSLLTQTKPDMAIASARKKKYGHPHPKVVQKLQSQAIPLLTTEKYGSIYFKIKSSASKAYTPYPNQRPQLRKSRFHHKH